MNKMITKSVLATCKREVKEEKVQAAVDYIMSTVDYVNSFNDLTLRKDGVNLDEIEVPTWATPFIFSATKVAIGPEYGFKDLIVRPEISVDYKYDPNDIRMAANVIANAFRESLSMTKAINARSTGIATLSQVQYSVGDLCRTKSDEKFIPIPLNEDLLFAMGEDWANESRKKLVTDYIHYVLKFNA